MGSERSKEAQEDILDSVLMKCLLLFFHCKPDEVSLVIKSEVPKSAQNSVGIWQENMVYELQQPQEV